MGSTLSGNNALLNNLFLGEQTPSFKEMEAKIKSAEFLTQKRKRKSLASPGGALV